MMIFVYICVHARLRVVNEKKGGEKRETDRYEADKQAEIEKTVCASAFILYTFKHNESFGFCFTVIKYSEHL